MKRLPLAFFTAAALCALGGMAWGIFMAAHQDFTTAPAHAHLNLVGWATLALMGTYYQLADRGGRLGWINFGLSTSAVVLMTPSLALLLLGNPKMEPFAIASSVLAISGMAVFALSVLSGWRSVTA